MIAECLDRGSLVARMEYYKEHTAEESGEHYAYSVALREIRNAPAADVAPVVHCRHCRSYNKPRLGWCSVHLDREGPDDFCGYGVRMDGGVE